MNRLSRRVALCLALGLLGGALGASAPARAEAEKKPALATATFAGGCFWSMELAFDKVDGVVSTTSGYTGGHVANPTYEQVSAGDTGHFEAVKVQYDPSRISYAKLLDAFWHNVDPLNAEGQFCDSGPEYRSIIFVADAEQRKEAEASKKKLEESGRFKQPIVTQILPATAFYPAEEYHQDFAQKNPTRYGLYRAGCRRDARLKQLWGDEAPKH